MRILILGDIVGRPGRKVLKCRLKEFKEKYKADLTVANCENASGGRGLTEKNAVELYDMGIDVITMGNHTWDKKEILSYIDQYPYLIRPANYPEPCPGKGYTIYEKNGLNIGIINLSGTVYLNNLNCPFDTFDSIFDEIKDNCQIILLDFHAEATSEKLAMGYYSDGRASLVYGTHTHVQTADKRILPNGTGYITDIGMTGPYDGILGVDKKVIINQFKTQRPAKYIIASGDVQINGLFTEINEDDGRCEQLENFVYVYQN